MLGTHGPGVRDHLGHLPPACVVPGLDHQETAAVLRQNPVGPDLVDLVSERGTARSRAAANPWPKAAAAWFPGGATDPELALVQVRIVHATYWANDASKITQLLYQAAAAVTGKPGKGQAEHATIHLG